MTIAADVIARFEAKVSPEPNTGCWLWTGAAGGPWREKYGNFKAGARFVRAHRFAWELSRGPIPAGSLLCHRCDNTLCVNPGHLFLGTPLDNMRDMVSKGRARPTPSLGEKHGRAKLTEADVRAARAAHAAGASIRSLAKRYGVVKSTMKQALTGSHWRCVS